MANVLHELGRQEFLSGAVNWATGFGPSGTIQAALMTYTVNTAAIKPITGATVATPCVLTVTSNGWNNGDVVLVSGVGGTLTANGVHVVSAQATNSIALTDYVTASNVVGAGAYTAGGTAVNLGGPSGLGTWASYSGGLIGTPVALTAETETQGTANAAGVTFTAVTGAVVSAIALIATASSVSGTVAGTDKVIAWIDGQQIVTCAATLTAGTALFVERLPAAVPTATVLSFDDGTTATMTSLAAQYARQLAVSSTSVSLGARATAPATGSGLPVTPNGGNISVTWDPNQYKIFKL